MWLLEFLHMAPEGGERVISLPRGVELEVSFNEPRRTLIHVPGREPEELNYVYMGKWVRVLAQILRIEEEERRNSQEVTAPFRAEEDLVNPFEISVPLWVALRGNPTIAAYLKGPERFSESAIANMMGLSRSTVSEYLRRVKSGEE